MAAKSPQKSGEKPAAVSSAPKYRLTYFNARGRAEPSRLILAHAGVEYEDHRVEGNWSYFKPKMPFGQLPILEVNGEILGQSMAIARYLAKEHGLAGKTSWESAWCDMMVDTLYDMMTKFREAQHCRDAEKKKELEKQFTNESIPYYTEKFESIIKKNNKGFLVGDSLTWADLAFSDIYSILKLKVDPKIIDPYPGLKALVDKVMAIPNIKKWIEKRPKTEL